MSVTSSDDRITRYEPVVPTATFAADFPVFDNDDIKVFVDGVERTDFAVSATYVQGISNDARAVFNPGIIGVVDVVGARDPRRTNRFINGAPLQIWQQNLALDTAEAEIQEAKRDIQRSHRAPYGESGGVFSAADVGLAQGHAEVAEIKAEQAEQAAVAAGEAAVAAEQARDEAMAAQPNAFPDNISALKALPTSSVKSAYVKASNNQYFWFDEDLSAEVAGDPDERRYVASAADPTGAAGAWVIAGSIPTGGFATNLANPPNVKRMTGRIFGGGHSNFSGKWVGYSLLDGIDPLTRALHNWGPRDSSIWWDSEVGGITIAATSRTTEGENWPGYPTYVPSSIPLSGFVINDRSDGQGQGWAIYGDAVRFYGFTLAEELTVANFGSEVKLSLYNAAENGSNTSVISWLQSGAGLDAVEADLANQGLSSRNVGHISAFMRMLSSFSRSGATPYVGVDPVAVGAKRIDGQTDVVYVCKVAHTTPSGLLFREARAANPTYWKALPAAYAGIQFAAGALAEVSAGSNVFSALEMTERTQISWWRNNASNVTEQSAFIWADVIPDGTPAVGITFMEKGVYSASKFAGNADGTYGAKIQGRGNSGNHAISFAWTGTQIQVYVDNTLVKSI